MTLNGIKGSNSYVLIIRSGRQNSNVIKIEIAIKEDILSLWMNDEMGSTFSKKRGENFSKASKNFPPVVFFVAIS